MKRNAFISAVVGVLLTIPVALSAQDKPDALKTYRLGRDLEAQGRMPEANERYDAAVKICTEEIAQNPQNMDAYSVLTWSLLRQKKYRDTIDWGIKAIKANPAEMRVLESVGEAYFYLDDFKESMKYFQRYVDGAPQGERVSVAYFFMGEIYRIQKKVKHADIAYTTAVKLEPNLPLWWYRLASVREQGAEYASAVAAYERVLALNPNHREAQEGLDRTKKRL